MYTVISGIGRLKTTGSRWITEDFGPRIVSDVISHYEEVYFKVSSVYWDSPRVVTLSALKPNVVDFSHTIQKAFTALGNKTIENTEGEAVVKNKYVKMADAVQAGYSMKRVKSTLHPDIPVSPFEADDLVLSKLDVSPEEFNRYCLVSVNGLVHFNDADDSTIYVVGAQISSRISRRNEVGILNFKDIGKLNKLPIKEEMIHKRVGDQPYANQIYIKVPAGHSNKTAMLVVGGYLQMLDGNVFKRVADDIFCIETQAIHLIDRYLESRHLIDLSCLELEKYGKNDAQFIRSELYSDENLVRYLTISQSFIVFIDSDVVRTDKEHITTGVTFGQYFSPKRPTSPVRTGFGLLLPYWVREDDKLWSLTVGDNLRNNLLIHTNESRHAPNPADNRIPYDREEISPAYYWHISSEAIAIV